MKPEISIIIPTLNEEKNLELCLDSIFSQKTDILYEVIVCDGESIDNTLKVAKQYPCRIVKSDKKSIAIQRNLGAKNSSANHLLFFDADGIMPENYLEIAHRKFEDKSLLAFCASFKFSRRTKKLVLAENITNLYFIFKDLMGATTLPGFNTNVRRNVFFELGGFRDVPLEDADFSIRIRKFGKTRYFSDFFAVTSSRRLEKMGILGTMNYYFRMELLREFSDFNYLSCCEYVEVRDFSLQEELVFSGFKLERDMSYLFQNNSFQNLSKKLKRTREEFLGYVRDVAQLLVDISPRVYEEEFYINRALEMIREKYDSSKNTKAKILR